MAVVLALCSAFAYGLSDFVGGFLSRRTSAWAVAVVAQMSASTCTALIAVFVDGSPTGRDFAWAAGPFRTATQTSPGGVRVRAYWAPGTSA